MIKLLIGRMITVAIDEGDCIDERAAIDGLESIVNALTFPNPARNDAYRRGRPFTGPDFIAYFQRTIAGSWVFPRGVIGMVEDRIERKAAGRVVVNDTRIKGTPIEVGFGATLRPYQDRIVNSAIASGGGCIVAPTGSGKTVIACGLVARAGVKAVILVHKAELATQAANAVRVFLGVEPGIIGGGKRSIGPEVTIAMVQSLDDATIEELNTAGVGVVILDEAHHCPADSFRRCMSGFRAFYRFGLTATPKRKDGLTPILFATVGPIVAQVSADELIDAGAITPIVFEQVPTAFICELPKVGRPPRGDANDPDPDDDRVVDFVKLQARLANDKARLALVAETVAARHAVRSIVLTERVDHAAAILDALQAARPDLTAEVAFGSIPMRKRAATIDRFKAGETQVLIATASLIGEGFDCPAVDTVFLAAPNANVAKTTQIIGRAMRPAPGKSAGVIVDFVDAGIPYLARMANKRAAVYRKFARPDGAQEEL